MTDHASCLPCYAVGVSICLQEILEVEQVTEENQGMELNAENVDQVRTHHPPPAVAAATAALRGSSSSTSSSTNTLQPARVLCAAAATPSQQLFPRILVMPIVAWPARPACVSASGAAPQSHKDNLLDTELFVSVALPVCRCWVRSGPT